MFAICLESSHQRGMGHLFRMLNFVLFLERKKESYIFFINNDTKSIQLLMRNGINPIIVDLSDYKSDWESYFIKKFKITHWINDRLDTHALHAKKVKKNNIHLITFDDHGSGAKYCDINICGLHFSNRKLFGKKTYKGLDYLILNPEIEKYRRVRTNVKKILVTLGGSDTYGVTIKVMKILMRNNNVATVILGPSFQNKDELKMFSPRLFTIKESVPSLIKEFSKYDLAITGGGMTPFEANASGLPCIIVANEKIEIPNGKFLESLGSSVFGGYHTKINEKAFSTLLLIKNMSENGINNIGLYGIQNVYNAIRELG